jgi:NADH dehydrogenase FAD-containing subunit
MKTLNDAIEMRNTILKFRESCDLQKTFESVKIIDHCVAGGGPTE